MGVFEYWKKLGVPTSEKRVQIRNNWNEVSRQKALAYQYLDEYKRHNNERFYGGFDGFTQVLTIRDDFELIESILMKDFDNFEMPISCCPINGCLSIVIGSIRVGCQSGQDFDNFCIS